MLGYSEAEILGQNFRIIFTPEDIEAHQADREMRTAAAEGRALDERWHLKKGGEPFWAQGLVMPLKDDADETRGFLKIIRDKTEERRLQDALKERTAELEEADLHKNEFLAMLAHELRNPLAAIRNAVTLAARSGTREDLEWSRDVTARQVKNFAHLIDDLLDVSRITQGKIQLRKELVDAGPVLRHAVEAVRPLVEERKHELLLSFTSTDLQVEADPTRLEQMVVNLLTNAAKYTPAGGRIQLIAGVEGGEFVCRVRDNGVGIPPELLAADVRPLRPGRPLARPLGGGPGHRPDARQVARRAARRHRHRHERRPRQGERVRPATPRRRGPRRLRMTALPEGRTGHRTAACESSSSTTTRTRPTGWPGS